MTQPVIKIEDISKMYRLGEVGTGTLYQDLQRGWARLRGHSDPFLQLGVSNDRKEKGGEFVWALKDINLEVQEGEILGIIGRNGAGKSTLLKLLSRVTAPTAGSIKTRGRIASLLEVGTGFHPELTGRENIYLNGAILGMTRREITDSLEEIVDFSGCAKYIDTPVKRYSSGMQVRLGFAVAAHLKCEILIVDEVLAVGDIEFQTKCIGKMKELSQDVGRTILFVSHNLGAVKQLCNKGLLIQSGRVFNNGDLDTCLSSYEKLHTDLSPITHIEFQGLLNQIKFENLKINNIQSDKIITIEPSRDICIELDFSIKEEVHSRVIIAFSNNNNRVFTSCDSEKARILKPGKYRTVFKIPMKTLRPGTYTVSIGANQGNKLTDYTWADQASVLTILEEWSDGFYKDMDGVVNIPVKSECHPLRNGL